MRSLPLPALLLVLVAPVFGQFTSARALVPPGDAVLVPGLPQAGLWSAQYYIGEGNEFLRPVDGGYLDKVEHQFVRWDASKRVYVGLLGGEEPCRVLPLGGPRLLIERDRSEGRTQVTLAEWSGAELHFFDIDVDAGSRFLRHVEQAGARVQPGDPNAGIFGTSAVVDGDPARLREALRTWTFGEHDLDSRLRRPTHEEMGLVWNYFELVNWVQRQREVLRSIRTNAHLIQRLGELHAARHAARYAYDHRFDEFAAFAFDAYTYGSIGEYGLEQYEAFSSNVIDDLDERIEKRMEWLATQVEVLKHDVAESQSRWGNGSPGSGTRIRVHVVVRRADGVVLEDTRARDEPLEMHLAGDFPEGLQYALRTMSYGDVLEVRVPPALAFGMDHGTVDVELELIESVAVPIWRPPLEGILGYNIAPVDATELDSGLRYRDLVPGTGATPKRGDALELQLVSWNARGDELDAARVLSTKLGAQDLPPGVNEGLATMQVGGQRVLFIPPHLAEQSPERRGMAQCVVVELVSCGSGTAGEPR